MSAFDDMDFSVVEQRVMDHMVRDVAGTVLNTAQARLLFIFHMGGYVDQGNLILTDSNGRVVSYESPDLAELINRHLLWLNPETTHWEARPHDTATEEDTTMSDDANDAKYYKERADAFCHLLNLFVTAHESKQRRDVHDRLLSTAKGNVESYLKREIKGDRVNFRMRAASVGADPEWFGEYLEVERIVKGQTIKSRYRVAGLDVDRPKNKVMLVTARGREMWGSVAFVRRHLCPDAPEPEGRRRAIQI